VRKEEKEEGGREGGEEAEAPRTAMPATSPYETGGEKGNDRKTMNLVEVQEDEWK